MKQTFTNNNQVKIGEVAKNFKVVDKDLKLVELANFTKPIKVILSVPSLDTEVCDMEVKKFSKKLEANNNVDLIVISKDLPFAQSRWCVASSVKNIHMLSDYKFSDFGDKYGLLLEELRLLGRAIIILNQENKITYVQYCENVGDHPNYDAAFSVISQ